MILEQERAAEQSQPLIIPPEPSRPQTVVGPSVPVPEPVAVDADNEIVVTYATTFHCPPCEALKRDIKAGKFAGFTVRVDNSFKPPSYPAIRYKSATSSTGWAYVSGYDAGTVPFLKGRLLRKVSNGKVVGRSKQVVQPMNKNDMIELHNSLHGGGNRLWPGDLETHLRNTHGVRFGP
jgi:hypothetical protein